jgi:hypothetical protein
MSRWPDICGKRASNENTLIRGGLRGDLEADREVARVCRGARKSWSAIKCDEGWSTKEGIVEDGKG